MNYLHQAFKALKGNQVRVNFDQPTRVLLLDRIQFKRYKDSKTFTYRGGYMDESPAMFSIPSNGEWHVVVELGPKHQKKDIKASVEKLVAPPK